MGLRGVCLCFFAVSSAFGAEPKTGPCAAIEHFEDCNGESNLKFYNVSIACVDGRNLIRLDAQFGIPLSEDLQATISMAQCDDYRKEDECEYLFVDIETDDICQHLTDAESGTKIYRDGVIAENVDCPLLGNYHFVVDTLFDQLLSYMPRDKPYILIRFRVYRQPELDLCVKTAIELARNP